MTVEFGRWTVGLDGSEAPSRELIGGKAWSIASMGALGLNVPPAFVVTTRACALYLSVGGLPDDLHGEIAAAIAWLESRTSRSFGRGPRPLLVSVRSGAPVSMPGMMDTVLNLGMNDETEAALAAECGDAAFARDTFRRFLELYARIVLKAEGIELDQGGNPARWRDAIAVATGMSVAGDAHGQLHGAIGAVFDSWNSRRARRYRQHHEIPDSLGTAVTVQAMAFGNLDDRSGTGVLFSRNPLTGDPEPYGEFLPRAQGEDVVSGRRTPKPLSMLAARLPTVHQELVAAARELERVGSEVQDIEFTVERGRLYLLQSRAAKLAPHAAVRLAIDFVLEGVIDETTALHRVTPDQVRLLLSPRLSDTTRSAAEVVAKGEGASPGVGVGTAVLDTDEAENRAKAGEAIVLARPTTSPDDLHGMIAARAVVTEQGGTTSHAAVVGRALGLPCVVGCGTGSLAALIGKTVTVDGFSGRVFAGALPIEAPDENDQQALMILTRWAAARAPLRVISPSSAGAHDALDLSDDPAASDPERIGEALAAYKGARGVRGGAIASEQGVRAAISAGLDFIVADPILPVLLAAARIGSEPPFENKVRA
jgi:pyruvate, orthophosphate dikinase